MSYLSKNWKIKESDPKLIEQISQELRISSTLSRLLINRGNKDIRTSKTFIDPKLAGLSNPFLLPDMDKAVERIRSAISKKEKILVYGDTDVDGVTSVTILYRVLSSMGADISWYVPDEQGYGLHKEIILKYAAENIKLLITVDCGINANSEIDIANFSGMDVIVTDHHLPTGTLPEAHAVVNPQCSNDNHVFKDYAGCAIAFKLAQALHWSQREYYNRELVVVDIETTGLNPQINEIVEIGAIKIKNFVAMGQFQSLVKTEKSIPAEISKIHGILDEDCKEAPSIKEVLKKFIDFAGDAILVSHNSEFDLGFIKNYANKCLNFQITNETIDTLAMSKNMFNFKSNSLRNLAMSLDLSSVPAHRAIADCMTTVELIQRIMTVKYNDTETLYENYLDLVALGSIADVVSMVGENRVLVKYGLEFLAQSKKLSLRMLLEHCGFKDETKLTSKQISWSVVPLLNAAGRLNKAQVVIEFLLSEDRASAQKSLIAMVKLNDTRRELQKSLFKKFQNLIETQYNLDEERIIVLVTQYTESGISGIIANQLVQRYGRPIIILTINKEMVRGCARAPASIDILNLLSKCKNLLSRYGGHYSAAGFDLPIENLERFTQQVKVYAEELVNKPVKADIEIDQEIEFSSINDELMKDIFALEPYGRNNPYPTFLLKNVELRNFTAVGMNRMHLLVTLRKEGQSMDALGRELGFLDFELEKTKCIDIVFQIEPPRKDDKTIKFSLLDLRPNNTVWESVSDEIEL